MPRNAKLFVLPTPKKVTLRSGCLRAPRRFHARACDVDLDIRRLVSHSLPATAGKKLALEVDLDLPSKPHLRLLIGSRQARLPRTTPLARRRFGSEGYRLTIGSSYMFIEARERAGLLYGLMTLRQILRNHKHIPCCVIEDWPDMAVRGIHMDVKGCTPTVAYMKRLIPKLAEYKINTLLMEYENAVQLDSMPGVAKPSAWSKSDVTAMAQLARQHCITFMPLVQSLGHVEYILQHDRYAHLRESNEDVSQYCPSNPDVFPFWEAQAEEVIDLFPDTKYFHVGADETRLLGHCRKCRARLKKGEDTLDLYLNHMEKIWDYVLDRGYTPVFWDDIISRDFSPQRIRRIPKDVAVMYWIYHTSRLDSPTVRVHGGSYARRESIGHEALRDWTGEVRNCNRWLDEMPSEQWRRYRKYLDDETYAPNFDSAPFIKMFTDYGIEVLGASGIKCGYEAFGLPNLGRRLDNVRSWARHIAKANQPGVVSTAWSRNASLKNPYLPFDTMWYTMCASAEFYWSADGEVDRFQAAFSRDFFGVDDDGWLAQVLEAAALPEHAAAARDLAEASVKRNKDVLAAYQLCTQIHRGFAGIFSNMQTHARGYYLKGLPFVQNRNIHGKWLKNATASYLKLEPRAADYYHRVMLPEEADELLGSQFRFFKEVDLGTRT